MSYLELKRKNMKEVDEEELLIKQVSLTIDHGNIRVNAITDYKSTLQTEKAKGNQ